MNASVSPKLPNKYGPTPSDIFFLCFLFAAMLGVGWVGHLAYKEGMKMEVTKRNGEAWAKWFTQAGLDRGKEGYELSACATGFIPSAIPAKPSALATLAVEAGAETTPEPSVPAHSAAVTPPPAPTPRTWGPCFKALSTQGGLLSDKFNPLPLSPNVTWQTERLQAQWHLKNRSLRRQDPQYRSLIRRLSIRIQSSKKC